MSPEDCFGTLCQFLEHDVPAELSRADGMALALEATAFEDYVAVELSVHVRAARGGGSEVVLADRSRCDVVRFRRIATRAAWRLQAACGNGGKQPTPEGVCGMSLAGLDEFDWDNDFENDAEAEEWQSAGLRPLLSLAASGSTTERAEAAQGLASAAQELPKCRATLAEALATNPEVLEQLLWDPKAPLATRYPAASALANASLGQGIPEAAAEALLVTVAEVLLTGGLPNLIRNELCRTVRNLQATRCPAPP